jgi:hypothetical protein
MHGGQEEEKEWLPEEDYKYFKISAIFRVGEGYKYFKISMIFREM